MTTPADAFAPPTANPPPPASANVDNGDVPRPNAWMYLAVGTSIVSGLFGATYAFQMMVFIRFYDFGWIGPWIFGAISLAIVVLGAALLKAKPPVAFAFIGLAVFNVLITVIWHAYAFWNTLFSPLGIFWLLLAVPTAIFPILAVGRVLEIGRFRKRLMEGL